MTIREYMKKYNYTNESFAKILHCSPGHLAYLSRGTRVPSEPLAYLIQNVTNGMVPMSQFKFPEQKKRTQQF